MSEKEMIENVKDKIQKASFNRTLSVFSLKEVEWLIEQAERAEELEKEFERYDITNHKIGMTINNPNTSDDEKWDKVNELLSEAWESDCIHCNGKGFNGLDYCPNCVRGEMIQENMELEQQNKKYHEAIKISIHELFVRNAYENDEAINKVMKILGEALEEISDV